MAWVFVVTTFIFILFIPTGLSTQHILVFFIGLVGVGASFLLFGLTATKKWKGYGTLKPLSCFFRLLALAVGCFILYLGLPIYSDVQLYTDGTYKTIQGIPTEVIDLETNRELAKTITVVIDDNYFDLKPKPEYYFHIDRLEQKTFIIHYLPNTMWVIDYEVK